MLPICEVPGLVLQVFCDPCNEDCDSAVSVRFLVLKFIPLLKWKINLLKTLVMLFQQKRVKNMNQNFLLRLLTVRF